MTKNRSTTGPTHQDSASGHPVATSEPLIIAHPAWCEAVAYSDRTRSRTPGRFDGPAEVDENHLSRVFHMDATDIGLTVALVQPYEMLEGRLSYVGEPAIEVVAHNNALEGPDLGVDLTVAEVELLISHLRKAIVEHGRDDWHLPVGVAR
jgi:hypothetical protein